MQDGANPYESPRQVDEGLAPVEDAGVPQAEFDVVELLGKNRPWKVHAFPDRLRFSRPDEAAFDLVRERWFKSATLHDALFLRRTLEVRGEQKRVFQFSPDGYATLKNWIGPPTRMQLSLALKKTFPGIILVAIVFLVNSLGTAIGALPFDPLWFTLGATMLVLGTVSRFVAHRLLFLIQAAWLMLLAAMLVFELATTADWAWLILLLFQLQLIYANIREFGRFAVMAASTVADITG